MYAPAVLAKLMASAAISSSRPQRCMGINADTTGTAGHQSGAALQGEVGGGMANPHN